jgi:hypothetical protein
MMAMVATVVGSVSAAPLTIPGPSARTWSRQVIAGVILSVPRRRRWIGCRRPPDADEKERTAPAVLGIGMFVTRP